MTSMGSDHMCIEIEKIIRTKRKTIALHITDDAELIVKAPLNANDKTIMGVILKHEKWIVQKKKEIDARNPKSTPKEFVNGEGFLYLGKSYRLKVVDDQEMPLELEDQFYLSRIKLSQAKEVFTEWYKKTAYANISERVKWHAEKSGFICNRVKITNAQKRWGSCSSNGSLNFSWRLIMAPQPVIDYVVIHELVHLVENNHAKAFWSRVKLAMPDYERHKDWLKNNGYLLRL